MTKANTALSAMTTNVNVGIDEVVSVFVARWEDGLHQKKEELQRAIKVTKGEIKDLCDRLKGSVDASEYEQRHELLGIFSKITDIVLHFEGTHVLHKKNTIVVDVGIFDLEEKRSYALHTKTVEFKIAADDVAAHEKLQLNLEQLQADLVDTMTNIKSVSRKERQVRGRISEMKLSESGLSELLQNNDILQLVHVE